MSRLRCCSAVVLLAAIAVAQAPPGGTTAAPALPDLGAPAELPADAPPHLGRIDRAGLRAHAYWLADDARAGRHTTSAGQLATVRYVTEHFQKLGLKPLGDKKTFLQHYPLRRTWLDAATSVQFTGHKLDRDLAVLPAGPETKLSLAGRFVFCGNGSKERVPAGLAGRIPLVVLPRGGGRGGGSGSDLQAVQRYLDIAEQLAAAGATAGVVCLLDDQGSLGNTLNYRALLPDHAQLQYGKGGRELALKIPLLVLSAAQSQKLLAHVGMPFDQDGAPSGPPANEKASGKLNIVVKSDDKAQGTNVIAVLEGTGRKQEAIVFSAHHDHVGRRLDGDVFNGADDNASGTAGLLEIAEAFAQGGPRPERSIVFLSVSGEELGLWGSDWYAAHPTWPLAQIVADINIDMIGRPGTADERTQMQITPSHEHAKFSSLVRAAVQLGNRFGITFTSGDQYYERSDHFNFAKHGVPVVFFCDGEHPDYHQVSDTADRLDYVRMEAIARLAAWSGWQVANDKARPQELGKQPGW
ncbi:MAG: M20/M25/M40 family metallo-hydrolase [Planctomycetes bacterium]|jgi:hypothetical protein|nr:M20/M25/M40 family metallo-hydrolase [Planctomycetota bacterium]